ncbi:MAG TPA: hypothetical protein PKX94_10225, partial [Opitutales bacterium]|nr:hypothetical protein [Opitutales bacterium]
RPFAPAICASRLAICVVTADRMPENPASTSTASETAKRGQTERILDFRLAILDCWVLIADC